MRSWGVFLVALGGLSFVWPMFGRKSMILSMFGDYETPAALGVISAGVVLFALSFRKQKPPA